MLVIYPSFNKSNDGGRNGENEKLIHREKRIINWLIFLRSFLCGTNHTHTNRRGKKPSGKEVTEKKAERPVSTQVHVLGNPPAEWIGSCVCLATDSD